MMLITDGKRVGLRSATGVHFPTETLAFRLSTVRVVNARGNLTLLATNSAYGSTLLIKSGARETTRGRNIVMSVFYLPWNVE